MMADTVKFVRIFGFILLVAVNFSMTTLAATESKNIPNDGMSEMKMQNSADKSHNMNQAMQAGMEAMESMEMSGDTDKDFAVMMKVHHQQALDMAKIELEHGKSPVMKAMAKKIITAQKREIAQFDSWLAKQK